MSTTQVIVTLLESKTNTSSQTLKPRQQLQCCGETYGFEGQRVQRTHVNQAPEICANISGNCNNIWSWSLVLCSAGVLKDGPGFPNAAAGPMQVVCVCAFVSLKCTSAMARFPSLDPFQQD